MNMNVNCQNLSIFWQNFLLRIFHLLPPYLFLACYVTGHITLISIIQVLTTDDGNLVAETCIYIVLLVLELAWSWRRFS